MEITINALTEIIETDFGPRYKFSVPNRCQAVVLCYNNGSGLRPYNVSLPHQVYVKTVEKMIAEHPETKFVTVLPVYRSYVDIATVG